MRRYPVLVNRGTYGAPELTAAAIEDLKRGERGGRAHLGEGAVQKTIDLPDGAALMLDGGKVRRSGGQEDRRRRGNANEVVASPQDDDEPAPVNNGDEQLNKALELLKAKNG